MASKDELAKLEAAIKDLEIRVHGINVVIIRIEVEVATLLELQLTLEDNIVELKKKHVTVMAQEFRKAREDLKKAITRLTFLKMDMATYDRAFRREHGSLERLRKQRDAMLVRLSNNVIVGKFGKKDGR